MRAGIRAGFYGCLPDGCRRAGVPDDAHPRADAREADVERPGQVFGVVAAITPLTKDPSTTLVLTMPIGVDSNGMPIGAQLVGRPFAEARLLARSVTAGRQGDRLESFGAHAGIAGSQRRPEVKSQE